RPAARRHRASGPSSSRSSPPPPTPTRRCAWRSTSSSAPAPASGGSSRTTCRSSGSSRRCSAPRPSSPRTSPGTPSSSTRSPAAPPAPPARPPAARRAGPPPPPRGLGAAAAAGPGDADEAVWNALRRVQKEEVLRIGLAAVAGDLPLEGVLAELSALADVCVARTFELVHSAALRRGPVPPMAVLGLGKLGGGELGYASDLDVIFVYDGDVDALEAATKVAQRLTWALGASLDEGRLYQVDTRLRPSGQKGTLVSSVAGWREYHRSSAQLWERQALIKCRTVAGDPALGR